MKPKKQSAMIIKSLEYKFTENGSYSPITIRQGSGYFQEDIKQTRAGVLFTAEITAYVPVIDETKQELIDSLVRRPAIFRIQDPEGLEYIIGTDDEPATFTAIKKLGPTPGVAYGWDIKITCLSVLGSEMSSFIS